MKARAAERAATTFRAVSHPTRIRILLAALELGELSPVVFTRAQGKRGPTLGTVSHHFRALAGAGMIRCDRQRQRRGALENLYRLTPRGRKLAAYLSENGGPS